jgi:tRNA-5-methyluridine54 2-sulfurtransferase
MKIETKIKETIRKWKLGNKKEKIVVALSGGKDSTVTAYVLKKLGYNIYGFHIDLKIGDYSKRCLQAVRKLCDDLKIPLYTYDMKKEMGSSMCYLRSGIQSRAKNEIKNCAICGVIKKWIINKKVREIRADKIATGHNLDDEVQTFLMNIFKGSPQLSANLGPITRNASDKKFIPRIKPLYYIPEDEVRKFAQKNKLPVVYDKCPCALDSYRIQVRNFVDKLSHKDKWNVIKNFEKLFDKIQKTKQGEVNYCDICGEPSRNNICRKCSLMRLC